MQIFTVHLRFVTQGCGNVRLNEHVYIFGSVLVCYFTMLDGLLGLMYIVSSC